MYITNPRGRRSMPRQGSVPGGIPRNERVSSAPNIPQPVNSTPNIPPAPQPQQQAQVQSPRMQAPQEQPPQMQAPRMQAPQIQPPQMQAPQMQASQMQAPQMQAPQMQAPQMQAPQMQAPRMQSPQTPTPPMSGMGYLVVRVTTANGAIPLEDAIVVVKYYDPGHDVISVKKTDISGLTEKISLPAPGRSESLAPGNGQSYSTYNIEINKEGYNPQTYINAPIFDGITSVQSADLVPLPENGETDRADPYNPGIFYESENPFLDQSQDNG